MNEIVYLNGSLIPREQARISPLDYGFLYGFGLFETMRAYQGRVFLLNNHLNRLSRAAKMLGVPVKIAKLKQPVIDILRANELDDARIRITVSPGEGAVAPEPNTCKKPTVLITAVRYQPYPEKVYQKGFKAIISSIRRNSQSPLSRLKSTNYLESLLAKQETKATGADEALLLNDRGLLAEASMSNIFLVTNGTLRTPGEESGILPGITRGVIIELASKLGINAVEDEIRTEELFQAEEAFLTNSLIEVMPLAEAEWKTIGSDVPGPITKRLMTAYKQMVIQSE